VVNDREGQAAGQDQKRSAVGKLYWTLIKSLLVDPTQSWHCFPYVKHIQSVSSIDALGISLTIISMNTGTQSLKTDPSICCW